MLERSFHSLIYLYIHESYDNRLNFHVMLIFLHIGYSQPKVINAIKIRRPRHHKPHTDMVITQACFSL